MIIHPALTTDNLVHFKISVNQGNVFLSNNTPQDKELQKSSLEQIQEYISKALEQHHALDKQQFTQDFHSLLSDMITEYYQTHTGGFDISGLYNIDTKNLDLHINGISKSLQIK